MIELKDNYQDDVLDSEKNQLRKYNMIHNDDGTVSFVDATVYSQNGDNFRAKDVNDIVARIGEVSKAENIAYDGEKSVLCAIDELKGTIGYSNKQLIPYPYSATTHTNQGIEWVVSNDGVISANGANTNNSEEVFHVISRPNTPLTLKKGKYILNGCADGGSESSYKLIISKTLSDDSGEIIATDYGNGCEFTLNEDSKIGVYIYIMPNATVDSVVFKPMIRYASIEDDTYNLFVPSVDGMVREWIPEGNNTQPHRCYYIKHKNSITIFFVVPTEGLTSTVFNRVICEDVCGTFGISNFRESFTVGFGLNSMGVNNGINVHFGISAKGNKINIERMGSDVANGMPVYGQITLVTV